MLYKNLIYVSLVAATLGLASQLLADDSVEKGIVIDDSEQPSDDCAAQADNAGGETGIVVVNDQPNPALGPMEAETAGDALAGNQESSATPLITQALCENQTID